MSSLITAIFKATIGLLVNKGRDKLTEKLDMGDVTDQMFRGLIVREIDEIKSKLDGLARKDLLASISLFREGIELLYEVFESARSSSEHLGITPQTQAAAEARVDETFNLAEKMSQLKLSTLDESATRKLNKAMETFNEARLEAIKAFSNEALKLPDRILAMQYRLMATILRTIDNPTDALSACRVCLDELHQVPAVKEHFKVELEEGLRALFKKDERRQIIFSVCHVNRVIHDVMQTLCYRNWWTLPLIDTGKEEVDPLRDRRVIDALTKQGLVHCCVRPWTFGEEGEEKHKLKCPVGIAANTKQQFLIAEFLPILGMNRFIVKVFDKNGKFVFSFDSLLVCFVDDPFSKLKNYTIGHQTMKFVREPQEPRTLTIKTMYIRDILDIATANDKIYLLVTLCETVGSCSRDDTSYVAAVLVYNETAKEHHKFTLRNTSSPPSGRLTVSRNKVLILTGNLVDVHDLSGEFVCCFGQEVFKRATDITATCDGRVIIVDSGDFFVYLFTEEGQKLAKFNVSIQGNGSDYFIAHHPTGEHVAVACFEDKTHLLGLAIYTAKGELLRSVRFKIDGAVGELKGITVTMESHIAVAFADPLKGCVAVI